MSHVDLAAITAATLGPGGWSLRSLHLRNHFFGAGGVAALAAGDWRQLQHLDLSDNELDGEAMLLFSRVRLPLLQQLDVGHNELDAHAVQLLAQADLPLLQHLDLSDNHFVDCSAMPFLAAGRWPLLHHLDISRNWCPREQGDPIQWVGAEALAKVGWRR